MNDRDLISRSALKERWTIASPEPYTTDAAEVLDSIDAVPAVDAVEVVRCRECKHCSKNTPDGWHWCDEHERGCLDDDDFCSYGERKDGSNDD